MESEKMSGGAAAAGSGGGDGVGGRLLVEESSSDVQSDRIRFCIELKHDETTIVSWTKLLRDSGIEVTQSSPPSPEPEPEAEPDAEAEAEPEPVPEKRFHQEDESRTKCSNVALKKEKHEQNYGSHTPEHCRLKKQRNAISEVVGGINVAQATKNTKVGHARVKSTTDQNYHNEKQTLLGASVTSSMKDPSDASIKSESPREMKSDQAAICAESQSITLARDISEKHSLNNGRIELPDLNVPYTVQAASILSTHIKDESGGMVNGSMLESTILELETMVAESRKANGDVQDADLSVATKSRLPWELKQKLETIARLAHSSQGRISDELIIHLMSILGHWLKPRALKRCLRDMVPADLSARGGDAVRFSQIKKEVVKMIKLRTPSTEAKDGPTNGSMELPAAHKARYSMDQEMEDKLCDFYDIYVQGMNETKSSEIRKFYIQLARLWPKGTMDNHGIRNAICRAKDRRRMLLQEKGHEKGKRKKSSTGGIHENLQGEANLVAAPERPINDTNAPVLTFLDTVVPGTPELDRNLSALAKRSSPPSAGSCLNLLKQGTFNILKDS